MEYWSIGAVVLSSAAASDDMPRRQVKPRFSRAFSANRFFNAFPGLQAHPAAAGLRSFQRFAPPHSITPLLRPHGPASGRDTFHKSGRCLVVVHRLCALHEPPSFGSARSRF